MPEVQLTIPLEAPVTVLPTVHFPNALMPLCIFAPSSGFSRSRRD